ncbi:iron-sulfur cluster assembly scaffold protein [Mycobacterium kansasii]|nr:iron-sulfur cluster assembly scaffold protein [Mycobacterium kansasii]EUA03617.1 nifU-like N terminal domain protein [Mycobacterium kansasii 824]ARG56730.1 iron-sulfur cluster assembly scaffold protein NifU [Mycobacterium kansasii]ARG62251.1 iron-sulfur cluster assembly scaffold protein NifU [Mycobacterium kansasii]ARG69871.1 iron-sulfur cluster assembly scaffold protein NifU [Mycobacterium kansasii]ARG75511.1 iron-sulfur cluster assembly scaffold protein NifU [Mycobacterium kansasii]
MSRYSPTVVDHFNNPRNCGRLANPDVSAFVGNPVCGDQILLTVRVEADAVSEVAFEAYGCSASLAVGSILTERLGGMTISDIAALDAARILQWSGGLGPDQHHVAVLGADAAHRLADNYRKGIHDDGTCFAG